MPPRGSAPTRSPALTDAAQCAAYLVRSSAEWATPAVERAARLSLLDWFGAAAHGLLAGGPRTLLRALECGGDVDAWPPGTLALVLGSAGYAHEAEQNHEASGLHVSTPIWPLVIDIVARRRQALTMQELCAAFAAGFEVGAQIGAVAHPRAAAAGWHTTPLFGAISATAAGAALLGLQEREAEHALGLAASLAGGTTALYATPGVALATGHAAWLAALALRLVSTGFRGPAQALGGQRSLLAAVTGDEAVLAAPLELHEPPVEVLSNRFKAYPAALLTHSAIEAVTELLAPAGARARSFHVRVSPIAGSIVDRPVHPTPEEERFSLQWAVREAWRGRDWWGPGPGGGGAAAGEAGSDDPEVTVEVDPDLPRYGAVVTATYADGATRVHRVQAPRGFGDRPIEADAIVHRFHSVVGPLIGTAATRELSHAVLTADDAGALAVRQRAGIAEIVRRVNEEES